jgi:hypothetical protein
MGLKGRSLWFPLSPLASLLYRLQTEPINHNRQLNPVPCHFEFQTSHLPYQRSRASLEFDGLWRGLLTTVRDHNNLLIQKNTLF